MATLLVHSADVRNGGAVRASEASKSDNMVLAMRGAGTGRDDSARIVAYTGRCGLLFVDPRPDTSPEGLKSNLARLEFVLSLLSLVKHLARIGGVKDPGE